MPNPVSSLNASEADPLTRASTSRPPCPSFTGSSTLTGDRFRSIALREFKPLAQPGVQLISLQKGPGSEQVQDRARDQIEYPDEDPMVRQRFESELAKRGLTSLMPDGAYKDPKFQWSYAAAD